MKHHSLSPIVAYEDGDAEAKILEIGVIGGEGVQLAERRAVADDVDGGERVCGLHGADGSEERGDGAIGVTIGVLVNVADAGVGIEG